MDHDEILALIVNLNGSGSTDTVMDSNLRVVGIIQEIKWRRPARCGWRNKKVLKINPIICEAIFAVARNRRNIALNSNTLLQSCLNVFDPIVCI